MADIFTENAKVEKHAALGHDYHLLTLHSPLIGPAVRPGQFVHLRVPQLDGGVLRRPFSVFQAAGPRLSILYRVVGRGTAGMRRLQPGDAISLLGPLGNGFPSISADTTPVLTVGGYGAAALFLAAARAPLAGTICMGARTAADLVCARDFAGLDWDVRIATEDGSAGHKGLATDLLDQRLAELPDNAHPVIYACGPAGMLRAVGERAQAAGCPAWLSLDRHMGCGMGACLACVQKVRRPDGAGADHWQWARLCVEGPVFEARDIIWGPDV